MHGHRELLQTAGEDPSLPANIQNDSQLIPNNVYLKYLQMLQEERERYIRACIVRRFILEVINNYNSVVPVTINTENHQNSSVFTQVFT